MTCFSFEPLLNLPLTYHRAERSSSKETRKGFHSYWRKYREREFSWCPLRWNQNWCYRLFFISCVLMFFRLVFLTIYFLGFMTLGCLFVSSYPIWFEMVIFFNPRFADLRDRVWATNLKNINQVVPYTFQIE